MEVNVGKDKDHISSISLSTKEVRNSKWLQLSTRCFCILGVDEKENELIQKKG